MANPIGTKHSGFWTVAGIVLSLIAPGTGHLLHGMWLRGASWLGGLFLGAALMYWAFPAAGLSYYSVFGLLMAILAACDLVVARSRALLDKEEPTILTPDPGA